MDFFTLSPSVLSYISYPFFFMSLPLTILPLFLLLSVHPSLCLPRPRVASSHRFSLCQPLFTSSLPPLSFCVPPSFIWGLFLLQGTSVLLLDMCLSILACLTQLKKSEKKYCRMQVNGHQEWQRAVREVILRLC